MHLLFLTWLIACSGDPAPSNLDQDQPVPDFSLEDVNATSATFSQSVSPRDHLDQVSAWYFGHAT